MTIRYKATVAAIGASLLLTGLSARAAEAPRSIPTTSIVTDAKEVHEAIVLLGLQKELVVEGEQVADTYFVGAETITFMPGAQLIFSDRAVRSRRNLIVAAKTIVMQDASKPGVIGWAHGSGPSHAPPQSGQAPAGQNGLSDGANGGPGSPGITGNSGLDGAGAPNLTLFVMSFQGAPPTIDLKGQAGGTGGQGQMGGNGGVGRQGSPATATPFGCRAGAGWGGNGGNAGSGGKGGTGGRGGAGGTVTYVSLPSAFPAMLQLIRADVAPGTPGDGGPGGTAGTPGPGGPQGAKSLPFCRDEPGRAGHPGAVGATGGKGDSGPDGISGDVLYTTLPEQNLKALFGF